MNILLTGASRGIGYDTALQLADEGHRVLALSRNAERLATLESLRPKAIRTLAFDISQPDTEQLQAWVRANGPLDAIVNNAGYLVSKPFTELLSSDLQKSFEVNFFGHT